jgi:hypothetical protein
VAELGKAAETLHFSGGPSGIIEVRTFAFPKENRPFRRGGWNKYLGLCKIYLFQKIKIMQII